MKKKLFFVLAAVLVMAGCRQRGVQDEIPSKDFAPKTRIALDDFQKLMTTDVVEGKIGKLNNISPY